MDELSTNELIKRCCLSDRQAQEKLYKKYFNYAMSIALRYSNSKEDSVEVLNDGFLKVFTKIHQFKLGMDFKSWIRKIIINTSIDKFRASKNVNKYGLDDLSESSLISLNENMLDNLIAEDVINLIQRLPEVYRLTFNLYEIEGYSHREIAKMLNINESKSRTNLSRAKKKLKILVNEIFDYEKNRE
jgi:RNA polymerase sigma factor (sigma-70 family)